MALVKPDWIFLDLDNTLWDFEANAEEALGELFHRHHLHVRSSFKVHEFIATYKEINAAYWKRYERGEIDKDSLRTGRFTDTFLEMGLPQEEHPENVWQEYLDICPVMTRLVPWAMGFLEMLKPHSSLAIITNGFAKTQKLKIQHSGIEPFIDFMLTSEETGLAKPDTRIFHLALSKAQIEGSQALYIGDTLDTDVRGSLEAQIPVIWLNHAGTAVPAEVAEHPCFLGSFGSLVEIGAFLSDAFDRV
jgi:putative hydrolase of the HAD superfamily